MPTKFTQAISQICDEKNLSRDVVMETVKAALASAYKKDYGAKDQEVRIELDDETGAIKVYVLKEVVENVGNKMLEISDIDANKIKKGAKAGDTVEVLDIPADFGRIAAQTAKQVIIQRIREAERDMVFEEFKDKEGQLVNGVVQRVEGDTVIVDLGKATGVLYKSEQMGSEHYYTGQRIKVYVVKVESATRGPQIVLSRSHPEMIRKLFEMEVPEILAGTIEIKAIAREGGERTKIAVSSQQEGLDPVGALVGQRGSRVQSVMAEIGDEKIDIILWDEDPKTFIVNALSPAKVLEVTLDEAEKKAVVKVPEDQLSLAIGKKGQNVRLAAKLTGWNVDIAGADESGVEKVEVAAQLAPKKTVDLEDEIIKNIESQKTEASAETEVSEVKAAVKSEEEPVKESEKKGKQVEPEEAAEKPKEDKPAETEASSETVMHSEPKKKEDSAESEDHPKIKKEGQAAIGEEKKEEEKGEIYEKPDKKSKDSDKDMTVDEILNEETAKEKE